MSETTQHSFLNKIVDSLLQQDKPLHAYTFILPGKRPAVFIKKILAEKQYEGILPKFQTIDELITEISGLQQISGIPLWLFAYKVYRKIDAKEDIQSFLKWFPTLLKDWDDMLKFSKSDTPVLEFMLSDERIKNWGELLGEDKPHRRNLNFWQKMNSFLPLLKKELLQENLATPGIIHEKVKETVSHFAETTKLQLVFCGFNAFTPVEEKLVRNLLQWDKALCFFQADEYYIKDRRQEAGKFLREHQHWKEFNEYRPFNWIENHFSENKNIQVFEVSGNIAQTKLLPHILDDLRKRNPELSNTAVVLLDENLLPPTLESLQHLVKSLNITMGFPLKNLSFSVAMKKLFYLQKQLDKNSSSYYYADLVPLLEELPYKKEDEPIIKGFLEQLEERNLVYISKKLFHELLGGISYINLLTKPDDPKVYLDTLIDFCVSCKFEKINDIDYENISSFEKAFISLKNQLQQYDFLVDIITLEVLVNQLVSTETIDFEGEPLSGLQLMGLLETRLLNFENVIMLSINEGKLPLGRTQNTYLPFDVRRNFGMNTFLENDSIYAYHFYRLIQEAKNVYMLFNGLTSGVNIGEKSRFITQIEMESQHRIQNYVVDSSSEPVNQEPIRIRKTPLVLEKLELWKQKVSPSHLNAYLYNPLDFYLNQILNTRLPDELEEEISVRNFGNLVHYTLDYLYQSLLNRKLTITDLKQAQNKVEEALDYIIVEKLKHSPDYYKRGMNYIHKSVAKRTLQNIIQKDLDDVEQGNSLEILALEHNIYADFYLDDQQQDKISFNGFADRIDRFNGTLRIIDYKSAKAGDLNVKSNPKKDEDTQLFDKKYKQEVQLSIYAHCALTSGAFPDQEVQCGIWSFVAPDEGPKMLNISGDSYISKSDLELPMKSVKSIILDILNPEKDFVEEDSAGWG
ncbi:PD-(D/E)XK nuclease family protein [Elizabethkingia anophelis]|uniref:PD-(D/E)XK nuclease family protein n=1 Tax=Elizabethkingia anophelis TaxID=1117645 RepID=UPI0021A3DC22|nr:PD-(D/E)XK nuclease family protein [Elizabethkingia anophelis]MCT3977253.1 PD-(D/E)XK nuclease family protein [Elizabethkingia anophelis]MCT4040869.1 PD-(D/E)XK nuclease family protein [Elizabethkingia anophelis]HAY3541848.1 PD-(D/E)XK nuclease family protein [Elizabethkingia anophelis]